VLTSTSQSAKIGLNQLYDKLWLCHNFFQPVMRLKEKVTDPNHLIER
jgi:hypothetical protein